MQVQDIPIKAIKVSQRARQDLGDLTELIASIKEKGILQPILVDPKMTLLAGGRRLEAARQSGLLVIPTVVRKTTGALDALEIEYIENVNRLDFNWVDKAQLERKIFDIKHGADGSWNIAKQGELGDQSRSMVALNIQLARAIDEIPELANCEGPNEARKLLGKLEERMLVESLVSDAKTRALKGVKIAEKNYKLGDVLTGMESLQPDAYHFAEVDPPYGVDLDQRKGRYLAKNDKGSLENYNELSGKDYSPFIQSLAQETFRVLKDGSFTVWWYGMSWHTETLSILREVGFHVHDIPAIWYKGNQGQTASPDTMLGSSYEPFFVCRKGSAKFAKPGRNNVFDFQSLAPSKKIHPTEKPLNLLVDILETFTFPGTRMVIPLLGSGVTLRACYQTGRIGFGWDLSKEYRNAFLAKVAEEEITSG